MISKTTNSKIDNVRHSLAHLLAAAVLKKFPEAKLGIGPTIENGFYYDFLLNAERRENKRGTTRSFTEEDLRDFEKTMRELIAQKLPFTGKKIAPAQAKKLFAKQPFKLDLIKEFSRAKKPLTAYTTGNIPSGATKKSLLDPKFYILNSIFLDLCRGGHIKNTSEINPDAFKLDRLAGAYWRGDEKNPQLQRVYGLAFATKKELDEHLVMREEAEKRDHKKLGPQLDLFTFSELVGAGLPLWTPKGTILRDTLDNFVWELRKAQRYERVDIPHITKKDLYEKSGHWEKFKEDLFRVKTREGHEFAIKPMNCPHHTQIYARKQWSYKELPQRYSSTTKVYRDEQSGELAGLVRVRSITQDDAHVFCRAPQAAEEMDKIWAIVEKFYSACGFPPLEVRLSFGDQTQPKKYLGSPDLWKAAERELTKVADNHKQKYEIARGEAAFYGPKIDFMVNDSLGRKWQVATIQLDMNMPERFDLACVNEKGEKERVVMVHAAIMGSIERFIAILLEHHAGKLPLWLSPVQTIILPISDKFSGYGKKVVAALAEKNIRTEMPEADTTLGKRIREAEMRKIPYILIVGEKEEKSGTVSIRHYKKGQTGELKMEELAEQIAEEIKNKTI